MVIDFKIPNKFKNPPPGNRYLISKGGREFSLDSAFESIKNTIL